MFNKTGYDPRVSKGHQTFHPLKSTVPPRYKKEKKLSQFFDKRNSPHRKFATSTEIFNYAQASAQASQSGAKGLYAPSRPLQYRFTRQNKQIRGLRSTSFEEEEQEALKMTGQAYPPES